MNTKTRGIVQSGARLLGAGVGLAIGAYAASVAITWSLYGHPRRRAAGEDGDSLLDRFIPDYEVVERHRTRVAAPVETAFAAACAMNYQQSGIVRAIFKTRALVLGSGPNGKTQPLGLLEQAKAWGWGVLSEDLGHEIVFGGVTKPWLGNPKFQALPPDEFRDFREPGYAKIVWTMRADPVSATKSVVSTETRVATTDPTSRAKFRGYWSFVRPGSVMIRRLGLRLVRAEAERRARIHS